MAVVKRVIKRELESMLERSDVISAAVTVTVDGLMLEKIERKNYQLKRLSTMGSSLMSLGDTIASELMMGSCKNLISENEQGIIAFMHITDEIVLVTLTEDTTALGMLLSVSRQYCEKVKNLIDSIAEGSPVWQ